MDDSLRELYQDVILDHSRHPRHFGPLPEATHTGEGHNPLCGDRVKIYLMLDANNRVADIKFEGKGCAISQASASLMTDMIAGRTVEDAEKLMSGFLHMVKGEADIGEDAFGARPHPGLVAGFFDSDYVAELAFGGVLGVLAAHAFGDERFNFFGEVLLDFLGEVVVDLPSLEELT